MSERIDDSSLVFDGLPMGPSRCNSKELPTPSRSKRNYQGKVPIPRNELTRSHVLQNSGLLDCDKLEDDLNIYCIIASKILKTAYVTINLVDQGSQHTVAATGAPLTAFPPVDRVESLCSYVIADDAPAVTVIADTALDPRAAPCPLCAPSTAPENAPVRFYAATPLLFQGHRVGTLCLLDREPREPLDERQRFMLLDVAAIAGRFLDERQQQSLRAETNCAQLMVSILQSLKPALTRVMRQKRAMEFVAQVVQDCDNADGEDEQDGGAVQRAECLADLRDATSEFRGSLRQLNNTIETSLKLGAMSVRLAPCLRRQRSYNAMAVSAANNTQGATRRGVVSAANALSALVSHTQSGRGERERARESLSFSLSAANDCAVNGLAQWLADLQALHSPPTHFSPLLHDVQWRVRASAPRCMHTSVSDALGGAEAAGLVASLLVSRALLRWRRVSVVADLSLSLADSVSVSPSLSPHKEGDGETERNREKERDPFAVMRTGRVVLYVLCEDALRREDYEDALCAPSPPDSLSLRSSPSPARSRTHTQSHSPSHNTHSQRTPTQSYRSSSRSSHNPSTRSHNTHNPDLSLSLSPSQRELREAAEALALYGSPQGRQELQFIRHCDLFVCKFLLQSCQGGLDHLVMRAAPSLALYGAVDESDVAREMFRLFLPCTCICATQQQPHNASTQPTTSTLQTRSHSSSAGAFADDLVSDTRWELQTADGISPFVAASTLRAKEHQDKPLGEREKRYASNAEEVASSSLLQAWKHVADTLRSPLWRPPRISPS